MFAQRLYKLVGKSTPPLKPLAQHIYELDRLSARFPEQLYKLLRDEEWVEGIQRLPKGKLVELIGYLDNVRPISTPTKSYSSSPQILDGLDHKGPSFEEGLHVLREICSSRAILPPTYNLGGKLSLSTIRQIISLRSTETYKGTLGNADVRIKRLNIKGEDGRDIRQVFHPYNLWLALHALTSLGGTLLGGCDVEAPQSPEHCVSFRGVTFKPLQIVSEWTPREILRQYVKRNIRADLISLVSSLLPTFRHHLILSSVAQCRRRS